jgi:phosphoribosylformimino-5-aminoimidazole carboxamide ribotide isomerase
LELIPVIDILRGRAVRARRGERAAYPPLHSALCPSSDCFAAVEAFLAVHPFTTLYLADLDAIQKQGDNTALIEKLHLRYPQLALWVDAGIADLPTYSKWQASGIGHAVIGSETAPAPELVLRLCNESVTRFPVLSLDFREQRFVGSPQLLDTPQHWPRRVIAMTLGRVGSARGPDFTRLEALRRRAPHTQLHAAGGIRDAADLRRLRALGVSGALLASALHDRTISAADVRALANAAA